MGRHLGIDFSSILVDFGRQLGKQNRAKIDGKKKGTMIAKKLEKVPARLSDRGGVQGPGEVPPFKAGQSSGAGPNPPIVSSGL